MALTPAGRGAGGEGAVAPYRIASIGESRAARMAG